MLAVTPRQMREIDQRAINEYNIPGIVLMENAALGAVRYITDNYTLKPNDRITIAAGTGNNGGDGFAAARHLMLLGYDVTTLVVGDGTPRGDAKANLEILENLRGEILCIKGEKDLSAAKTVIDSSALIVDALFGTGLDRPLAGVFEGMVKIINQSGIPVVSLDIPSGINGENGHVMGTAVRADATVTFGYAKCGHLLYPGRSYTGKLKIAPISLPRDSGEAVGANTFFLTDREAACMLKDRPRDGHKGTFGKVAVIAGSTGLTGAAWLASTAAARSGAGLVTLGIPASLNPILASKLTEVMTAPLEDEGTGHLTLSGLSDIIDLVKDKDVLAIGPGLGKSEEVFEILRNIFAKINISIVIDADGLNHISKDISLLKAHKAPVVLTPHPGEMARLTGRSVSDITADPMNIARSFAAETGAIVLLKSAATVVAEPSGRAYINTTGNSSMAKGGSGDALTGMVAALIAQGYSPFDAAVLSSYIHGKAGDLAANALGEVGMLPGDLVKRIPDAFKMLYELRANNSSIYP